MADDMRQIIAGIKSSYDRTNMRDVDLEAMLASRPEVKVGYLLQNMEPESRKKYAINFDPVQTLFLDKLVTQGVLDKRIVIEKGDFFRGIVFLDYMVNIILNRRNILDDLHEIAGELERRQHDLDPDLGLIVRYAGMCYLHHAGKNLVRGRTSDRETKERYRSKNKKYEPEHVILRKISPVYEALGAMVCSLPQDEAIKQELPNMLCLYDIKAAIFVDSVLQFMQDDRVKEKVMAKFQSGDYYRASVLAISGLSKEVAGSTIDEYIASAANGNGGSR
jgi:hypothetical protein